MFGRPVRTAALAALLGLGAAGPVLADGPPPDDLAPGGPPPPAERGRYGLCYPTVVPGDPAQPGVKRGCWATHFNFGCGSFHSDMVFIFGSCRAFYGEACRKGPPPLYPPGTGPAAGYDPGPGYGTVPGYGAAPPPRCNNCW
jgi:hypothetical protein